jgi:preprotein translocase subunit Sss1
MFVITGLMMVLLGMIGYAIPRIRNLETELPDHVGG